MNCCKHVTDFQVNDFALSDHFPIELTLNTHCKNSYQNLNLLPKLSWINRDGVHYTQKLEEACALKMTVSNNNLEYNDLINLIKSATNFEKSNKQVSNKFKEKWFDYECFRKRKDVLKNLNNLRRYNSPESRILYLSVNKEYKALCIQKRTTY